MADYWKSQPKKFCQYCKCWIADNKPSIDFHERGKNHKENVAAKIAEIKKKSIDKAKLEERMSKEFAIMEEAALKAFQEDLKQLEAESGPVEAQSEKQNTQPLAATTKPSDYWVEGVTDDGLTYYYNTQTGESQWDKPEGFKARAKYSRKKEVVTQISSGCLWMEALSADGYTYYYNTETGESSWEKPTDYCSQSESSSSSQDSEIQQAPLPPQPETLSEEESISKVPCLVVQPEKPKDPKVPKISFRRKKEDKSQPSGEEMGEDRDKDNNGSSCDNIEDSNSQPARLTEETPAKKPRKSNPYGEWEQIQKDEDPYEQVDLQLPQVEGASAATEATDVPTEPKVKFVERTITSLGDESDTGEVFRKRKLDNGKSRSLRQRGKDD